MSDFNHDSIIQQRRRRERLQDDILAALRPLFADYERETGQRLASIDIGFEHATCEDGRHLRVCDTCRVYTRNDE